MSGPYVPGAAQVVEELANALTPPVSQTDVAFARGMARALEIVLGEVERKARGLDP